jgi:hypothetical protein
MVACFYVLYDPSTITILVSDSCGSGLPYRKAALQGSRNPCALLAAPKWPLYANLANDQVHTSWWLMYFFLITAISSRGKEIIWKTTCSIPQVKQQQAFLRQAK